MFTSKRFSVTQGGGSIDSCRGTDAWLQSEVEREKRKIERYISTQERRNEANFTRDVKL